MDFKDGLKVLSYRMGEHGVCAYFILTGRVVLVAYLVL